jgi:uncharacterized protein (DUF1501 family)
MKRSLFLRNSFALSMLPLVNALQSCNGKLGDRPPIFIFIQLVGGNDGLNTLIPLDNYKNLIAARPNLFIPESKVLPLKGTSITGLHPAMEGIRDLFDHDLAQFVHGVGYENQNYSHFRSQDIYLTGSGPSEVLYTGWIGRFLEKRYRHYPVGFPNSTFPDPPAVKVGDNGTFLFEGPAMDMSIVISPTNGFEPAEAHQSDNPGHSYADEQLKTIQDILSQTQRYAGTIRHALGGGTKHSDLYPKPGINPLADQLKMVAKLIHGGLQTQVYHVDLKGFDTHANQVEAGATHKGVHANLLHQLSQAITCFWDDMVKMGEEDRVAGMTFSEFGRRIISNAAGGTDHGSSQPLLFFGKGLHGGITGTNPPLPDRADAMDNLKMQYDFRSVYAAILTRMGAAEESKEVLPGHAPLEGIFV